MTTKEAVVFRIDGLALAGRSGTNHWVTMDSSREHGGHGAGSSPKELLLLALAGCSGLDVLSIVTKRRARIDRFEVRVTAQERDEHPRIFTAIHLEFVLAGEGILAADVERAIELSQTKYCSVSAMLRPGVPITTSYRIDGE